MSLVSSRGVIAKLGMISACNRHALFLRKYYILLVFCLYWEVNFTTPHSEFWGIPHDTDVERLYWPNCHALELRQENEINFVYLSIQQWQCLYLASSTMNGFLSFSQPNRQFCEWTVSCWLSTSSDFRCKLSMKRVALSSFPNHSSYPGLHSARWIPSQQ